MEKLINFAKRYAQDESGVVALEYLGLAAAVAAGVVVLATGTLGSPGADGFFGKINTALGNLVDSVIN